MASPRTKIHSTIFFTLLCAVVAAQPFTSLLDLPIAIALLLNWIGEGEWKAKWDALDTRPKKLLLLFPILLFLSHASAIAYSSDTRRAIMEIEYKIWFFVAPLLIFTSSPGRITPRRLRLWAQLFILSCLLMIVVNFSLSTVTWLKTGSLQSFGYIWLSHFMHPSYSSMIACVAFILSARLFFTGKRELPKIGRVICAAGLVIFPLYIFMLQSKAGLLAFAGSFILMGSYLINYRKRKPLLTALFLFLFILLPSLLFIAIPEPYNRMKSAVNHLQEERHNDNPEDGTNQRLAVWKSSWSLVKQHPVFGVGPGDVKGKLFKEYADKGYTHVVDKQLNAHNQYLQTLLGLGVMGLSILLAYLLLLLFYAMKSKQIVPFLFTIVVLVNFFTESMLERKAGADFIALGCALFGWIAARKKEPA